MDSLIAIKPFIKEFNKKIVLLTIIRFLQIPIAIIVPFLFKILVDDVMLGKQVSLLKWVCIGYIIVFIIQTIVMTCQKSVGNKVYNKVIYKTKSKLWNNIMKMPITELENYQIGDLKNRIGKDADAVNIFIEQQIIENLYAVLSLAAFSALVMTVNWKLALCSYVMIPVSLYVYKMIGKGIRNTSDAYRSTWGEYESWMFSSMQAWKEVKQLTAERNMQKTFISYWKILSKKFIKQMVLIYANMSFESFKDVFINKFFIYFIGGILVFNHELTIGGLLIFMRYFEQLYNSVSLINTIHTSWSTNLPSFDRVLKLLSLDPVQGNVKLNRDNPYRMVEFQNVYFKYKEEQPWILSDINFRLSANQKIGIVGKNGSGKTTIVRLLLQLNRQINGKITIDGHYIETIAPNSLHKNIGVVMQDNIFFNMTIRENLQLAKSHAHEDELREACQAACIDEFIDSLPEGFDTAIGENGAKLSGGQRQRLAIARVFLSNPSIIIFDEVTSLLDHISEKKVHEAIINISKNRAIIIITHRLPSVLLTDQVMVMDKGHIVGFGHHSELLGNNSIYDQLFKEQYKSQYS